MPIWKVTAKKPVDVKPRLVKAERLKQVESFILGDTEFEKATAEDCHALAQAGVKIEEVGE